MIFKKYFVFIFFFTLLNGLNAQEKQRPQITITGKVLDAENNDPVEYVSVALFRLHDSLLVDGTVTKLDGSYELTPKMGKYFLRFEFLSYETIEILVPVKKGTLNYHLDDVLLNSSFNSLEEFTIEAEQSRLEFNMDKKTFNVGKDLSSIGGSATDVLENVPSITVDEDGNISLRGNNNVKILIDGRPSGLVGISSNEALQSIPADLIEKVEVVTNPSAKYQASGSGGIINIILKKKKDKGINGSFGATIGWPHNYQASSNINYRKGLVNIYGGYSFRYIERPGKSTSNRETFGIDTNDIMIQKKDFTRNSLSHLFTTGADFDFKNNTKFGFNGSLRAAQNKNLVDLYTTRQTLPSSTSITTLRTNVEIEDEPTYDASAYYIKKFKTKGEELEIDISYSNSSEDSESSIEEYPIDSLDDRIGTIEYEKTFVDESQQNTVLEIDYVKPLKQNLGRIESGYRGSYRIITNNFLVQNYDTSQQVWTDNLNVSNIFNYNENIQAAYLIYSNTINEKLEYKLGLRGEYSIVNTELKNTGEKNLKEYFDLFPTAHFSYKFSEKESMMISYSRRIKRPGTRSLNPFFSYSNPYDLWVGNPDLNPVYTNAIELGYIYYGNKLTFSPGIYYNYSLDNVYRITTVDSNNVSTTKPENLGTKQTVGLEIIANYKAFNWWKLDFSLNGFYTDNDNDDFNPDYSADFFTWNAKLNSRITFWQDLTFIFTGNYSAEQETAQGIRLPMYFIDLGLSKDFFNDKGTLSLKATDILNTRKYQGEYGDINYYTTQTYQRQSRMIFLSFNYRLNDKKNKRNK